MRLLLQLTDALHHILTLGRNSAEHLQEGAGVHRVGGLHGEGIGTVGNIGHGLHALVPHAIHRLLERVQLVFHGGRVSEGVDLVDEARHAGPLAEHALHIGELHMAVGVHETGAQDARFHLFVLRAQARTDDGAVLLHFHEGVAERLTRQGIYVFCGKTLHKESL